MRISFCADCHVGNFKKLGGPFVAGVNRRCGQAVEALRRAATAATAGGSGVLVVAGDLFDYAKPEPQVIAAVQGALAEGPRRVVILRGNHDATSDAVGDHALGPLAHKLEAMGGREVSIIDVPTVVACAGMQELLCIPWQSGPVCQWLPDAVAKLASECTLATRILVLHAGIVDDSTPAFLRGHDTIEVGKLAELMWLHGIRICFAGHHHVERAWRYDDGNLEIYQIGTLAPTGFSDAGVCAGSVAHYAIGTGVTTFSHIVGPRFLRVASVKDTEIARRCASEGNAVYTSIRVDDSGPAAAISQLDQLRKDGIMDGEVVLSGEEQMVAARSAAAAVRAAGTLEEALAAYVNEMIVAGSVRKEDVLALCKKYLATTGGGA
jgi:hypothetical protein